MFNSSPALTFGLTCPMGSLKLQLLLILLFLVTKLLKKRDAKCREYLKKFSKDNIKNSNQPKVI